MTAVSRQKILINSDYLVNIFIRRLLDQGIEKYGKNDRNFFVELMYDMMADEEFKKRILANDYGIAKSTLKNREKMLELLKWKLMLSHQWPYVQETP